MGVQSPGGKISTSVTQRSEKNQIHVAAATDLRVPHSLRHAAFISTYRPIDLSTYLHHRLPNIKLRPGKERERVTRLKNPGMTVGRIWSDDNHAEVTTGVKHSGDLVCGLPMVSMLATSILSFPASVQRVMRCRVDCQKASRAYIGVPLDRVRSTRCSARPNLL